MKLIKPSWEIWEQEFPVRKMDMSIDQHRHAIMDAMYRHIERCGRTCYKSEDKITEDSAKGFVDRMIASQHYAMLEHGTIYLLFPDEETAQKHNWVKYHENPFSMINLTDDGRFGVTTNFRVIIENDWVMDLIYMCCPTKWHEKRHCVHLVTNIHVYKDLTRHRSASFAIESTRYCNYTKDKFGNELTFIIPCWCNIDEMKNYGSYHVVDRAKTPESAMMAALNKVEEEYFYLINQGWKPQQAATILPQATKADVIITSFASHWQHIFNLRTSTIAATGQPHPQVAELMNPLYEEFKNRNYV